jgi:hypothetical protein
VQHQALVVEVAESAEGAFDSGGELGLGERATAGAHDVDQAGGEIWGEGMHGGTRMVAMGRRAYGETAKMTTQGAVTAARGMRVVARGEN